MAGDSFERRVAHLRDSWAARRQVRAIGGAHDFDSQLRLLGTLHQWACSAAAAIAEAYGDELAVHVSALALGAAAPAFSVTLGGVHTVTFALDCRERPAGGRWAVAVTANFGGNATPNGVPERRNGPWTRGRLEDVLLSVLGAWERSRDQAAESCM